VAADNQRPATGIKQQATITSPRAATSSQPPAASELKENARLEPVVGKPPREGAIALALGL
jgi:hypothetical protein